MEKFDFLLENSERSKEIESPDADTFIFGSKTNMPAWSLEMKILFEVNIGNLFCMNISEPDASKVF